MTRLTERIERLEREHAAPSAVAFIIRRVIDVGAKSVLGRLECGAQQWERFDGESEPEFIVRVEAAVERAPGSVSRLTGW